MKAFGYSYLLDLYGTRPGAADDLELHYRFLEQLVSKLLMTPMSQPVVIHAPRDAEGRELFPDKAGVSGWVPLIESGIQIHSVEPSRFITLDVYSCKWFSTLTVLNFARETFGAENYSEHHIERGSRYGYQEHR
jgi:S-adenosylmethionine/arginine decarboxylase-like enzyme